MKFHHIGIATDNIENSLEFIKNNFQIKNISQKVYDKEQNATLQIIETIDCNIELVSGDIVKNFIKNRVTYYHICYVVADIYKAIKDIQGGIIISPPKPAILFNNRLVAFVLTPLGIMEFLNEN